MNKRRWEIYALRHPLTLETRYIGVTFRGRRRFNEHLSRAVKGGRTHLYCWIRSLLVLGLRPIFTVIESGVGESWSERERALIAKHRDNDLLTNLTDGGEGTPGYVPTAALRRKWSKMRAGVKYSPDRVRPMLGRKHSSEALRKIRLAGKRRRQSAETRAKIAAARKGQRLTAATRLKLSKAHKGKKLSRAHRESIRASTKNHKPVVCVETGKQFASITQAARVLRVTETSVNQSIRKGCRCKGSHYKFR